LKVTIQSVRIFGSKHQYGPNPRSNPIGKPLTIPEYPSRGCITKLILGEFPKSISEAYSVKQAIGMAVFEKVFVTPNNTKIDSDQLIRKIINKRDKQFPVNNRNWYITVAIEKKVNIVKKFIADREYCWVDPKKMLELEDKFYEYTQTHLSRITSYVLNMVEPKFFSDVVLEGIFFYAPNRIPFGWPKFSGKAEISVVNPIDSLEINSLRTTLSLLRKVPESEHQSLDSARHWYLTAIKEKDEWKKFLWHFLTLEILTNKLSEKFYDSVLNMIELKREDKAKSLKSFISELVPDKKRLNLTSKFIIMSLGLSQGTAKEDLKNFKKVKKARNDLAHGVLRNVNKLPISLVSKLTEKYFRAAIEHQLANKGVKRKSRTLVLKTT